MDREESMIKMFSLLKDGSIERFSCCWWCNFNRLKHRMIPKLNRVVSKAPTEDKPVQAKTTRRNPERRWLTWKAKITIRTISKDGVVSWIPLFDSGSLWKSRPIQWSFKTSPRESHRHGLWSWKHFTACYSVDCQEEIGPVFENSNMAHSSIALSGSNL